MIIDKETFDAFSQAEKRKAIAADVIERINNDLLVGASGALFETLEWEDESISVKDFLNETKCSVCAKGALVCSWIGNFNKYDWDFMGGFRCSDAEPVANYYPKELIEIFGAETLDLMEAAFEGSLYSWCCFHPKYQKILEEEGESIDSAYPIQIISKYTEDLRGIMLNIIENEGEFKFDIELATKYKRTA